MATLHIGIDDTDSPRMGCTTYIAALLVEKFTKMGVKFIDYPNLIRLNPNVPWKTRGNGALCLRIQADENILNEVIEATIDMVEANADMDYEKTDPGVVFFPLKDIPEEVKAFSKRTIQGIVRKEEALKLIKRFKAEAIGFKRARGVIGALAAIGEALTEDYTYELLAYRIPENRGKVRKVDLETVKKMDEETKPYTFNNIDEGTGRILITPRGPDPILYGIRGESPEIVKKAHKIVEALEPIERWVIFRTNQGTDAHLKRVKAINEIKAFHPVIAQGVVVSKPRIIPRRHVVFSLKDETGEVDCAAYEPTGKLRRIARNLILGDLVEVYGGVKPKGEKHTLTINLEKLKILKASPLIVYQNPLCPKCGKRMKSTGKLKGYKCKKCGFKSKSLGKTCIEEKREIKEGLYITDQRSQRHLTKPTCRYGFEKHRAPTYMIENWHFP